MQKMFCGHHLHVELFYRQEVLRKHRERSLYLYGNVAFTFVLYIPYSASRFDNNFYFMNRLFNCGSLGSFHRNIFPSYCQLLQVLLRIYSGTYKIDA